MKKILLIHDYFYLGEKCGGPHNSVKALYIELSKYFIVDILTLKTVPISFEKFNIVYENTVNFNQYHSIILNSFFSLTTLKSLLRRNNSSIVIIPRGELMKEVLRQRTFKFYKKQAFIFLFKCLAFFSNKKWVLAGTNDFELKEIKMEFGKGNYLIIPNSSQINIIYPPSISNYKSAVDILRIVYFSRIDRKKNLEFTLLVFSKSYRKIQFDIFGESVDPEYFEDLLRLAKLYSSEKLNITFCGHENFDNFKTKTNEYNLAVLHSIGENYSHSIVEMFYLGIPILISDNTPWRFLKEKGLGWDLALDINKHLDIINNFETEVYEVNLNSDIRSKVLSDLSTLTTYKKLINFLT